MQWFVKSRVRRHKELYSNIGQLHDGISSSLKSAEQNKFLTSLVTCCMEMQAFHTCKA